MGVDVFCVREIVSIDRDTEENFISGDTGTASLPIDVIGVRPIPEGVLDAVNWVVLLAPRRPVAMLLRFIFGLVPYLV